MSSQTFDAIDSSRRFKSLPACVAANEPSAINKNTSDDQTIFYVLICDQMHIIRHGDTSISHDMHDSLSHDKENSIRKSSLDKSVNIISAYRKIIELNRITNRANFFLLFSMYFFLSF